MRAQKAIQEYLSKPAENSPSKVSKDRLVLSAIYAELGSIVAETRKDAEIKAFMASSEEIKAYKKRRDDGGTAADSKIYATQDCEEIQKEAIESRALAKKYELLHKGVGEILNSLASRIKVLEMEARNQS